MTAGNWAVHRAVDAVGAGTGGPVDFDGTLFIMIALFLGLMVFFTKTLYQPYLRLREERHKRIQGAKEEAKRLDQKAKEIFRDYETKLAQAVREGEAERRRVREDAKREQRDILNAARTDMDDMVRKAKAEMDAEMSKAEASLLDQARGLSTVIVEKVLAS